MDSRKGKINWNRYRECYVFGGLLMDYYYYIDSWPVRGQDGFISDEKGVVGGCAINIAATVKNLGGTAHVISAVGTDSTGTELVKYMNDKGFSQRFINQVKGNSGKCLVFLEPDGERTFLTEKGAEGVFTSEMDTAIRAEVPGAAAVTGYYLLSEDAPEIMDCIEYLSGKGAKVLFDPSPLVASIDEDILRRIIGVSRMITPNRAELKVIESIISIEDYCRSGDGKTMVVKSGAEGGTVHAGQEDGTIDIFEYNAEKCEAVDTTGAGDSFAGALVYGMVNNMPIRESVELAVKCSARTVQVDGPHGFWKLEER